MAQTANRFSLTITDTHAPKTRMDYGIDGWLDWDVETQEQAILRELETLRAENAKLSKTKKTKKEKKPKAPPKVPKYVSEAGANHKAQRRLQGAGKLEPFRSGGCRCRTWGNGLGSQCHAKATTDEGFCKTHYRKVVEDGNGLWTMGFYDTPRPEVWGEELDGVCHPVPNDRKKGNTIPWKMDKDTFTKAFTELNRLDQAGRVELDLVEAEGSDSGSNNPTPEQSEEEQEVVEEVVEQPVEVQQQAEVETPQPPEFDDSNSDADTLDLPDGSSSENGSYYDDGGSSSDNADFGY